MEANSIAAKAMGNSDLSTLVSALQAADLAQTLKSEGEYTVFAPTNATFAAAADAQEGIGDGDGTGTDAEVQGAVQAVSERVVVGGGHLALQVSWVSGFG